MKSGYLHGAEATLIMLLVRVSAHRSFNNNIWNERGFADVVVAVGMWVTDVFMESWAIWGHLFRNLALRSVGQASPYCP